MKNTAKEELSLTEIISQKLESMGGVTVVKNSLFKDEKKFAVIKNNNIHLIDKNGNFNKINKDVIENTDLFLKTATEAYWIASGKI